MPSLRSVVAALTLVSAAAHAQSRPTLSLSAGVSQFDLSGTGTTRTTALRLEHPLAGRWLLGEGGIALLRPLEQGKIRRTYAVPEVQIQTVLPTALVRPYLGVGAGWFRQIGGDARAYSEVTVSGTGGVRVTPATSRLGARAELRVRGIGTHFEGASAEWTAGLSWRW